MKKFTETSPLYDDYNEQLIEMLNEADKDLPIDEWEMLAEDIIGYIDEITRYKRSR